MKRIIFILFTLQTLLTFNLFSQPVTQEWAKRYNAPQNLSDLPKGIALDRSGNIYVTGISMFTVGTEFVTIKYNPAGVEQWVKTFKDTTAQDNVLKGIKTDSSGNVYVIGYCGDVYYNSYYSILIKYSTDGNILWIRKYTGSGNASTPNALAVDNQGNIYVTGGGSDKNVFLIKYNSSGDSLWTRKSLASGHDGNTSNSIALDTLGNVYIGGNAWIDWPPPSDYGFLALKYNSSGNLMWNNTYNVRFQDQYEAMLVVNKSGNVFLTGRLDDGTNNYDDYITIKYNSNGTQQWIARYNSGGNDMPFALAADNFGNVIVTGKSSGWGTGPDYCTIKYNGNGDSNWVKRYSANMGYNDDEAYAVTTDSYGNTYVTGRSEGNGSSWDFATLKYSPEGIQQWLIRYNGTGNAEDEAHFITVDNSFNVYVLGGSVGLSSSMGDFLTIKYNQPSGIISSSNEIPERFSLSQNYPNPFNPKTRIKFSLPSPSKGGVMDVKLIIYDVLGREVTNLIPPLRGGQEGLPAGIYEVDWDGTNYPSGVYFYRLTAGDFTQTRSMVLLK